MLYRDKSEGREVCRGSITVAQVRGEGRQGVLGSRRERGRFIWDKIGGRESRPQQQNRILPLVLEPYLVKVEPTSPLGITQWKPFHLT